MAKNEVQQKENLFVATCYKANYSSDAWFVDNGCTHHMTYDASLFIELRQKLHFKGESWKWKACASQRQRYSCSRDHFRYKIYF